MKNNIYTCIGASNHSLKEREKNDYYATEPKVIKELFSFENFSQTIWECACGEGHLSKAIKEFGKDVFSSDLIDRGYQDVCCDFLQSNIKWDGDIITNPPYKYALDFVKKSLEYIYNSEVAGLKVAMFLKLTFLESKQRYVFFKNNPPKVIYVFSSRRNCAMNGDFKKYSKNSAVAYAWFVWEKDFKGKTTIEWIE
jgi:hypothetical protein